MRVLRTMALLAHALLFGVAFHGFGLCTLIAASRPRAAPPLLLLALVSLALAALAFERMRRYLEQITKPRD